MWVWGSGVMSQWLFKINVEVVREIKAKLGKGVKIWSVVVRYGGL